jgi:hypothetical protein
MRTPLHCEIQDLKETDHEPVTWGELLHNRIQWQPFVMTVWKFKFHSPAFLDYLQ